MKWMTNCHESEVHTTGWGFTFAIGDPEASDVYTVEQLKAMGMVGVYEITPEEMASVQIKRPPLKLKVSEETPF